MFKQWQLEAEEYCKETSAPAAAVEARAEMGEVELRRTASLRAVS